jgi:hypothetical protein
MRKSRLLIIGMLSLAMLASCVSRKKYTALQAASEEEKGMDKRRIDSLIAYNELLKQRMDSLESTLTALNELKEKPKEKDRGFNPGSKRSSKLTADEEYNSKAMYMYNFCKYVQWPSSFQSDNFIICVAGESPLTDKLTSFTKGKTINNKKIVVRKYDPKDKSLFHILFVPENQSGNFGSLKATLQNNPTLLVSENASLNNQGAHIGFTIMGDKVKYSINKPAAEKTGLQISQDLVKFAVD